MRKFILITVLIISLENCKKSAQASVMINVENLTDYVLDSVELIYDASHYNYSTVQPDNVSEYHLFKSLPDDAVASAYLHNEKIIAGCLIPPNTYSYPTLTNGKYTLQIFPDSALLYGYNARFIKN